MIRKVLPCLESLVPYAFGHLATDESNEILIPEAVSATSSVSGERFENIACVGKLRLCRALDLARGPLDAVLRVLPPKLLAYLPELQVTKSRALQVQHCLGHTNVFNEADSVSYRGLRVERTRSRTSQRGGDVGAPECNKDAH